MFLAVVTAMACGGGPADGTDNDGVVEIVHCDLTCDSGVCSRCRWTPRWIVRPNKFGPKSVNGTDRKTGKEDKSSDQPFLFILDYDPQ